MSITVELTPEEEILLRRAAETQGQDVPAFIKASALTTARNQSGRRIAFASEVASRWQDLERLGHEASDDARAELRDKGIPAPFLEDGILYEELPDGTVRPIVARR